MKPSDGVTPHIVDSYLTASTRIFRKKQYLCDLVHFRTIAHDTDSALRSPACTYELYPGETHDQEGYPKNMSDAYFPEGETPSAAETPNAGEMAPEKTAGKLSMRTNFLVFVYMVVVLSPGVWLYLFLRNAMADKLCRGR